MTAVLRSVTKLDGIIGSRWIDCQQIPTTAVHIKLLVAVKLLGKHDPLGKCFTHTYTR